MLYAVLEKDILTGEWLLEEVFTDQDEAINYLLDNWEINENSNHRLVEYKANRVII